LNNHFAVNLKSHFFPFSILSRQAAGHRALVPKLVEQLREADMGDVVVVCGGVIPQEDYEFLKQAGVSAIFGPGTKIPDAVDQVLSLLEKKL
jgi:methylmalonyl-CoA mutase